MNAKYRVDVTEHERGWGDRPDFYIDFDDFYLAEDWAKKFNYKNTAAETSRWYQKAGQPYLVDLDVVKPPKE